MCIRQKEGDFFMRTAIPANEQITYKKGVIPVLRALLFGYILSFALMAVTAVILWLSHAGDSAIRPIVLIITLAAMILSGRYAAKNTSFRGFVIGGAVGLSYIKCNNTIFVCFCCGSIGRSDGQEFFGAHVI